mgnify:CR=1 FL=1
MKKWIVEHPIRVNVIYWCIYIVSFFAVERIVTTPRYVISSPLDDMIPFTKYAIVFYVLWFPYIAYSLIYFVLKSEKRDFWKLSVSLMVSMMPTLLFYILMPNGIQLRPSSVEGNDIFAWAVRLIWNSDNTCNVCPSLHVIVTVLIDMAWTTSSITMDKPAWRWASHVVDILICASTVLLKQHSIIDVFCGIGVAVVVRALVEYVFAEKVNAVH